MHISELQEKVDRWIRTIGVKYYDPLTNTAILMEETGELARIMARRYGQQSWKNAITSTEEKKQLADEMADVLWVLTCLANQCDINLTDAVNKNFDKKTNRDADRHRENNG